MKNLLFASLFICSSLLCQDTLPSGLNKSQERAKFYQTVLWNQPEGEKYSIIGTVIDQFTREPIGNAKVSVLGTKFTATTSADGQYTISTSNEGIFQIKAEAEGYEPQTMNNVYFEERKKPGGFFTLKKSSQEPPDFVEVDKQPIPKQDFTFAPQYPAQARKNGTEGTVWVKIWIDKKGIAKEAIVTKSDAEIFNQPSIDAAMKWKFEPAMLKGQPVDVWVTIPFKFRLDGNSKKSAALDEPDMKAITLNLKSPPKAKKIKMSGDVWIDAKENKKGIIVEAGVRRLHLTASDKVFEDVNISDEQKKKISAELYNAIEEMKKVAVKSVMGKKYPPVYDKNNKPISIRILIPIKFTLE